MDVKLLGTIVGVADGWDPLDTAHFVFYNFQPNNNTRLFAEGPTDMQVDYLNGMIELVNSDTGETYQNIPMQVEYLV